MAKRPRPSRIRARIEAEWGLPLERVLWRLYVTEGLPERALARRLGMSPGYMHQLLVACGIPRRQVRAIYTGSEKSTADTRSAREEMVSSPS